MGWNRGKAVTAALWLSACGGGGSGGGGAVAVVPGGGATPTPSPTPTATSTPTPAVSYEVATDFARSRLLSGNGVELSYQRISGSGALAGIETAFTTRADAVAFEYFAATRAATFSYDGDVSRYVATDQTLSTDTAVAYGRQFTATQRGESLVVTRPGPAYLYLTASRQFVETDGPANAVPARTVERNRYVLLGSPTTVGDTPASGSFRYPAGLQQLAATSAQATNATATGSLQVDFAAGTVSASFTTSGTSSADANSLVFTGRIDALTKAVTGSVGSADNGYAGTFAGRFFGPRGVELGLVFQLSRPDGTRAVGEINARQE